MKNAMNRISSTGLKMPVKLALLALTLTGMQVATAAEPGWYFGGNVGESKTDINTDQVVSRQTADGFTNIIVDAKEDQTGYKLFTGYQFGPHFAIEGGYFDLGEFSYRSFMRNPAWAVYTGASTVRGVNLDFLGFLPLGEKLSAFGRVGVTRVEIKDKYRGYGAIAVNPFNTKSYDHSHKFGAGLQYDFTDNFAMRLEAERYDIDKDAMFMGGDVDLYSVGIVYRFGRAAPAPAPVPVSTAPRTPVATPAPAPAPTPAPAPAPVRVTLSADSLFTFDSAVVTPAGRAELDELAADLRGVEYDTIIVIGHTDRMGSDAYNQGLSTRRANAVRDYLISSARIPAASINTRGVGSSQPVTTMQQCGSQLSRAQLITCLAPDRRVEVEVTGTRPR